MYCQSCGTELFEGLRYCKRCGTSLKAADDIVRAPRGTPRLTGIVLILAALTFACMVCLLSFAGAETHDLGAKAIVFIVIAGLAMVFGVDALIVKFLSDMYQHSKIDWPTEIPRREIPAPRASVSEMVSDLPPVPSVTEHTTRSFDPSRERLTR